MFAKLFETDRGQILVKLDTDDDDAPEIRFYVQPPGLGVCYAAFGFKGVEFDEVEQIFLAITEDRARESVADLLAFSDTGADAPPG